jgi:hypothetical protein
MRRLHQRQILELLGTLGEAHSEIKRRLSASDIQAVTRLLADCQDVAAQVGRFIERLAGEGTKTVSMLEEYHELLYRTSLDFERPEARGGEAAKRVKPLRKRLRAIEDGVRGELAPDRIEIAFIPYKASMWDALESVWSAADADPACDAYVIPAPYYDRLPGGAFGDMRCEGGDYPSHVPVVDWNDYDFEERRPDVIFTHNPYDDDNLVTSIHPDFYCERLKALTDLLVYIPYYIVGDDIDERFCVCAGTLFADRVFVESEKIRRIYVRAFKDFEKKRGFNGRFGNAETKFVALGSPKLDKVLNTKREDCALPDAWRRLIERPDGSRKKVVFYNTSIGALLGGNERYLAKLRSVLDLFRCRDDVVLWWRPHPLSVSTYRAMRPWLSREYGSIVAEYRREGFGVYDDTADLHRAIAWSDAYYGDGSSVTELIVTVGKPIMFQLVAPDEESDKGETVEFAEDYKSYLAFDNLIETEDCYWTSPLRINGLFKIDKRTWKSELVTLFRDEEKSPWRLYANGCAYNGKLWLPPNQADEIAIYDYETHLLQTIPVPEPPCDMREKYNPQAKFWIAFERDGLIYFIPALYPGILVLNPATLEMRIVDDWVKALNDANVMEAVNYFCGFTFSEDRKSIFLCSVTANAVMRYTFEDDSCTVFSLGGETGGYRDIIRADGANDCWLVSSFTHELVLWDSVANKTVRYSFNDIVRPCYDAARENFKGLFDDFSYSVLDQYPFAKIVRRGDCLYLTPLYYEFIVKFDLSDKSFAIVDGFSPRGNAITAPEFLPETAEDIFAGWNAPLPYYAFCRVAGNKLQMHTQRTNKLVEFDLSGLECREQGVELEPEDIYRIKCFLLRMSDDEWQKPHRDVYEFTLSESNGYRFGVTLNDYITALTGEAEWLRSLTTQMMKFREASVGAFRAAGERIYSLCKEEAFR